MNEASTPVTIRMDQRWTCALIMGSVSPAAVALRKPVDVEIEHYAEDDEPEENKLAGEPEVEGAKRRRRN